MNITAEYEEMRSDVDAAKEKQKAVTLEKIGEANCRMFTRECLAAGVDPARGVSPSLLRLLAENPAPTGES